ncbi:hypothetical protein POM88_053451 [Heracleum sosnowskyi]|uniref:RNase H type-1 domain-containing protein n=1 Tax=Heracleum sosnowskyi TaxID=360622 RepID=A0AAD8LXG8_9APIA|nr:hypothetical protein POM88_053451 [Heracleum sosnowskyi]
MWSFVRFLGLVYPGGVYRKRAYKYDFWNLRSVPASLQLEDMCRTIDRLKSDKTPPWHVAAVVEDLRALVSMLNLKFYFIPRLCNAPTHWIAKKALYSALSLDWICCPPCDLSSLLWRDLL